MGIFFGDHRAPSAESNDVPSSLIDPGVDTVSTFLQGGAFDTPVTCTVHHIIWTLAVLCLFVNNPGTQQVYNRFLFCQAVVVYIQVPRLVPLPQSVRSSAVGPHLILIHGCLVSSCNIKVRLFPTRQNTVLSAVGLS